jgi:hypothetical protein
MASVKNGSLLSGVLGTVGGLTVTKDGIVRQQAQKRSTTSVRGAENQSEFGSAGKATKVLRAALPQTVANGAGKLATSRISKKMSEAIKLDLTSVRGQRNVLDGELSVLEGFEFNMDSALGSVMNATIEGAFIRATGVATLEIPAYVPAVAISAPAGTTHYAIVAEAALADFEMESVESDSVSTAKHIWNGMAVVAETLTINLSDNSTHPAFVACSIEFYQYLNGDFYKLDNNQFNAGRVVKVDTGV